MVQNILVYVIIFSAFAYMVYSVVRNLRSKEASGGCAGCSGCDLKNVAGTSACHHPPRAPRVVSKSHSCCS
ncbi:FeoB-associated Cys-rich membrane protein [Prolixibacter sp. NT017]|uniref:FeoB-associated Cys-rich membrane protein n=1 Tax=Prolixibacter sp. NT017 TaxID=2652390 RepID=UPI00129920A0|nr:FeoB-associated Cys-rich membrane protein [Prolixibacter sp. NT017]